MTGFMSNRGRQVKSFLSHILTLILFFFSENIVLKCKKLNCIVKTHLLCESSYSYCILPVCFCRLYAPFLYEIWALTGVWELNGSKLVFWIMTLVPIMEIGPTAQVIEFS